MIILYAHECRKGIFFEIVNNSDNTSNGSYICSFPLESSHNKESFNKIKINHVFHYIYYQDNVFFVIS